MESARKSATGLWITLTLLGLPILYLLTIPPLAWCEREGALGLGHGNRALEVYAIPWRLVYDSLPPGGQKAMQSYAYILAR
jgi:hypothetical protein